MVQAAESNMSSSVVIKKGIFMLSTREMGQDAKAEVTRDMVEKMLACFDKLSSPDGVLTVELRGNGLFVLNPKTGTYETVGIARMSPAMDHLR